MKLAVMQPYLFPYIGYWQLMKAADLFVLLDDVNYITRGWINRNRMCIEGEIRYFSFPVEKASQNRRIQDTKLCLDHRQRENLLRTFRYAYRDAPELERVLPILETGFRSTKTDLVDFIEETIEVVKPLLNIDTPVCRASCLRDPDHGKGQAGILELCRITGADSYLNPIGGKELYSREAFRDQGVTLQFLQPRPEEIMKILGEGVWDLSILDLLLRFSPEMLTRALECYQMC